MRLVLLGREVLLHVIMRPNFPVEEPAVCAMPFPIWDEDEGVLPAHEFAAHRQHGAVRID